MNKNEAIDRIVVTLNCDNSLWKRFQTKCQEEGTSIAATLIAWIRSYVDGTLENQTRLSSTPKPEGPIQQSFVPSLETNPHGIWEENLDRRISEYLDKHLESRVVRYLESYLGKLNHPQPIAEMKDGSVESESVSEGLPQDLDVTKTESLAPIEDLQQKIELLKQWVLLTDNETGLPQIDPLLQPEETPKPPATPSETSTGSQTNSGIAPPTESTTPAKTPAEVKMPDGSAWRSDWAGNYELMSQPTQPSVTPGNYTPVTPLINVLGSIVTESDAFTVAEKLHSEGYTYSEIAHFLNEQHFTTKRGKQYNKASVGRLLATRIHG